MPIIDIPDGLSKNAINEINDFAATEALAEMEFALSLVTASGVLLSTPSEAELAMRCARVRSAALAGEAGRAWKQIHRCSNTKLEPHYFVLILDTNLASAGARSV